MSGYSEVRAGAIKRVSRELAREMGYPGWGDVSEAERGPFIDAATRYVLAAEGDRPEAWAGSFGEPLAREFHETYERLAPEHGYETREASAKPWEDVPAQNKNLMIAVCREVLRRRAEEALPQRQDSLKDQLDSVLYLAVKAGAHDAADAISGLLGKPTLRPVAIDVEDEEVMRAIAEAVAPHTPVSVVDFARWIIRLDDPNDEEAVAERQRVTMTGIIDRARRALAEAGLGPKG